MSCSNSSVSSIFKISNSYLRQVDFAGFLAAMFRESFRNHRIPLSRNFTYMSPCKWLRVIFWLFLATNLWTTKSSWDLPSLTLTPKNGWLEDDCFLLGWPIFRCELLVSGRIKLEQKRWCFALGTLWHTDLDVLMTDFDHTNWITLR